MTTFKTKMLKGLSAALLLVMAAGAQAAVVTVAVIDFDGDGNLSAFPTVSHSENNFTLTSNQPGGTLIDNDNLVRAAIGAPGVGADSNAIFFGANFATSTLTLAHDNAGYSFDLTSFDASSLYNAAGVLTLNGTLAGGGSVSQNINLTSDLTTINVTGMDGLSSLDFTFDGQFAPFDIDNITVNVIPIPAAVWLFGSAMGLLTFMRRRAR